MTRLTLNTALTIVMPQLRTTPAWLESARRIVVEELLSKVEEQVVGARRDEDMDMVRGSLDEESEQVTSSIRTGFITSSDEESPEDPAPADADPEDGPAHGGNKHDEVLSVATAAAQGASESRARDADNSRGKHSNDRRAKIRKRRCLGKSRALFALGRLMPRALAGLRHERTSRGNRTR